LGLAWASAVTVAFDATVLGLVAGIGGLVIGKLRRRWYEETLEAMEQAIEQPMEKTA
jgi:biopolymer transport protein ExbB/TolQ